MLAAYYNHRLSKDIYVFITNAQYLSELSPRFNSAVEEANDYLEKTNFISLTFPEGKVEFITSGQLTEFLSQIKMVMDKEVPLDDPVEIVAKNFFTGQNIFFRVIFLIWQQYITANVKMTLLKVL